MLQAGISATAVLLFAVYSASPQTKSTHNPSPAPSSTAGDRLGLPCAQILEMSSTDWVAKFNKEKDSSTQATLRAVATYGKCYEARTNELASTLVRKRTAPPKTVRDDFAGFENALSGFIAKAVTDVQPKPDAAKTAYIDLYEKQFRREFYTEYADKNLHAGLTPEESDQFTKAKNRFGELLGLQNEDKAHELHEAFGEIVGTHQLSLPLKLALYRYSIFILEPPSEKPFGPPPF
jgi:hypothetical protein